MKKYLTALILSVFFLAFPAFSQSEILYPPFGTEEPHTNPKYGTQEDYKKFFEETYRATWEKL